jgi:hypothetical protein
MDEDFFLYTLIDWAERGIEVPITLSVGGTLVAGYMISEEKYFEESAKVVRWTSDPAAEKALQDLFRSMSNAFDKAATEVVDAGSDPDAVREKRDEMAKSCLHLRDTYITSSGQEIGMQGTLFRCKRRAVDGFWLGISAAH